MENRGFAHGDALNGKDGEPLLLIVITRVIPIRPFEGYFIIGTRAGRKGGVIRWGDGPWITLGQDMPLENDFRIGGRHQVAALCLGNLSARDAQQRSTSG